MKIIDLNEDHKSSYFLCLEDWSDEIKEAGDHKSKWYEKNRDKGLRVKLALDENGVAGGMIQYMPIEHTHVAGEDLYFIFCIHIHGYKQGRGNYQRRGFGKALMKEAEEDVRSLGAKGIAAWGVSLPFWMKASWFKKHGYKKADKDGIATLLWKPFTDDTKPPKWNKQKKKPEAIPGSVTVTSFKNGWCPAMNLSYERSKRASEELGDGVIFREIDTTKKENFEEWGISDALYIDNRRVNTGPPPKYEKIKKKIEKKLKKIKSVGSKENQ